MEQRIKQIETAGIVPVVAIHDGKKAEPLGKALAAGGVCCAEITFRTAAAAEAIESMVREVPQLLVGAGTVLSCTQADEAISAGAGFIVTPGFNPRVVDYCLEKRILIIPGCSTPSDMEQAIERNLGIVKFFPAEQAGGLAYIKAVSAPYHMLRFMPTGGIRAENLGEYLSFPKVIACGGSWMVHPKLIEEGKFDEIQSLCTEAVLIVHKTRRNSMARRTEPNRL